MAEMIMDGIIALNKAKKYVAKSLDGLGALKGANCVIDSIDTIPEGNRVTFSWTGTDGITETSTMIVENGVNGNDGANGADGVGVSKIEKINTVGLVDTYRITFTDNTTYDYSVTNGQKGEQGIQGLRGEKGEQGEQGVQGVQGIQGEKGDDGYPFLIYKEYSDISEFNKNDFPEIGLMFMIVADGASSFPVYRYTGDDTVPYRYVTDLTGGEGIKGEKGDKGEQGEQGVQGENGKDGITYIPTIGTVTSGDIASATVVVDDETSTAEFSFVLPKGDNVTVDAILSNTSENPVQNKVIKQAIDNKADKTVATTLADGLMSASDKSKLDSADNTYALKSKYGDTTINVGRKAGTDIGEYSVVIGRNSSATKQGTVAEGMNNTASGYYSHAEGSGTTASGYNSHSEGWLTTASGEHSHAGGRNSRADGFASFAHGHYVNAFSGTDKNAGHAAFGMYNLATTGTLFSIGDGTADDARHNAFEITKTGGKLHDKDIATTDLIPASLPANGGNADTVGGKVPEKIFYDNGLSTDLNSATQSGCYATTPDTLNSPLPSWWLVDTMNFDNIFIVQKAHNIGNPTNIVSYIRNYANDVWTEWKEISTTPIKSTDISGVTDPYSNLLLWKVTDARKPILVTIGGYYAIPFLTADREYFYYYAGLINCSTHEYIPNTSVSGTVYYIEV